MKLTFNILGIFVLITLAYFIGEYFYSVKFEDTLSEEEGIQESGLLIKLIDGNPVVQISQELQEQAGITGTTLKETEYQHSFIARGKIIDLTSLVGLNSKLRQLQTLKSKSAASLEISNKEYRRLQLLHADAANISTRELQQAKMNWISDKAEYEDVTNQLSSLYESSVQQWGKAITGQLFDGSKLITELLTGQSRLLLISLHPGQLLPEGNDKIVVYQPGQEQKKQTANYISQAPYSDSLLQGLSYFFYTGSQFPRGISLMAEIYSGSDKVKGVELPESAIIWYSDKPWVYIKSSEGYFVRKEIRSYQPGYEKWFVEEGINPGEYVITSGAQMLLSEEFHWSIPDEDDNP